MFKEEVGFFGRTYEGSVCDLMMNREQTWLEPVEHDWFIISTVTPEAGCKAAIEATLIEIEPSGARKRHGLGFVLIPIY